MSTPRARAKSKAKPSRIPRTTYPGKRVRAAIIDLDDLITGQDRCTNSINFRNNLVRCNPKERKHLLQILPRLTEFLTGYNGRLEMVDREDQ